MNDQSYIPTFPYASYKSFLKATAVGFALLLPFEIVYELTTPGAMTLGLPLAVVYIWFCIKVMQSCYAKWAGVEVASRSIFWMYIVSAIVSVVLLVIVLLPFAMLMDLSAVPDSSSSAWGNVLQTIVLNAAMVFVMARFVRQDGKQVPAWRPIKAYWRPFYNGWDNALVAAPVGQAASVEEAEDKPSQDQE